MKNSKEGKLLSSFKDNIWAAGLSEMRPLSFKNWCVKYWLCVIDVFIKCAWVKPLKDKKPETVLHDFVEIENESRR